MKTRVLAGVLAFGLCSQTSGWAAEKKGVKMPDQINQSGHSLVLNGLGVRKAYSMVSVYVAGLYLEKTSHSADEILSSKERVRLVLHFLMDVDQDKIRNAWSEGLTKNCTTGCKALATDIQRLNGWMEGMQKGGELIFDLPADSVTVSVGGEVKGTIQGEQFRRQFLGIFLGSNPPNKGLKDGLLGLEP